MGMGFKFQMGMGMGMKSLKREGIGTKNLFPHTSSWHAYCLSRLVNIIVKKLNRLKHLVRTTVAELHN